jgi:hypothetical protein
MDLYITGRCTPLFKELVEYFYVAPKPEGVRINLFFDIRYILDPAMIYVGMAEEDWRWYTVFAHRNFKYDYEPTEFWAVGLDKTKFYTIDKPTIF